MNYSYVSGFFDADGCVSTFRTKGRQPPQVKLVFGQNRVATLEAIQDFLGYGGITRRTNGYNSLVIANRRDIRHLIKHIYPESVGKRKELKLAYELAGLVGTGTHNNERRIELMTEIRALKRG
jgi:hypothetical protein